MKNEEGKGKGREKGIRHDTAKEKISLTEEKTSRLTDILTPNAHTHTYKW